MQREDSPLNFPEAEFQAWKVSETELNTRLNQYVFKHPSTLHNAGDGLFFRKDIPANTVIGFYQGQTYEDNTPRQHAKIEKLDQDYLARADVRVGRKSRYIVVDASNPGTSNLMRYANDSRDDRTNVRLFVYERQKRQLIYAETIKDVKMGEEAFVSYGDSYWEDYNARNTFLKDSVLSSLASTRTSTRSTSSRSSSSGGSRSSQQSKVSIPKFVKTKGFISIPTYANRKLLLPPGCPSWETLCTQDNQYMVRQKGQCKCVMYQNGDDTACEHRQRDAGGCNPLTPHAGDETKKNGEPYAGKDLRMTFIPLERDGMPTVPACGCYKDDIQKRQARERKARERKKR